MSEHSSEEIKEYIDTQQHDSLCDMATTDEDNTHQNTEIVVDTRSHSSETLKGKEVGMNITFRNLTYSIKQKKKIQSVGDCCSRIFWCCSKEKTNETKIILHSVTGMFRPGRLAAVMGATGSGKTTLLDILAGRKTMGKIQGELYFDGKERDKTFKSAMGYIEQHEVLIGELTVKEMLMFAARLKLPQKLSEKEKQDKVDEILKLLDLESCANTRIGTAQRRGISGGQAKRVSIGLELLTNPKVLFIDELTSGLDNAIAYDVIKAVHDIARTGRTVVMTLHQPSAEAFALIDDLMLLNAGKTIYFGKARKAVRYFRSLGFYPATKRTNPADFLVAVSGAGTGRHRSIYMQNGPSLTIEEMAESFSNSSYGKAVQEKVQNYIEHAPTDTTQTKGEENNEEEEEEKPIFATSPLYSLYILLWRLTLQNMRSRSFVGTRFLRLIALALILISIYPQQDRDQDGLFNLVALLFFVVAGVSMGTMAYLNELIESRTLFIRERVSAMYRVSTYWSATMISEAPIAIISAIAFSSIIYWVVGFNPGLVQFIYFTLVVCVLSLISVALGHAIAASVPNLTLATALVPLVLSVLMIFGGFLVRPNAIPGYWIWAYYLSYFRYAFQGLAANELRGTTFSCASGEPCPYPTGEAYLATIEAENTEKWSWLVILIGFYGAIRVWGYAALRFFKFESR